MRASGILLMRHPVEPGPAITIANQTCRHNGDGTGTITASYKLDNDGNSYKITSSTSQLEQWLQTGAAGDYEVRATKNSGTNPSGSAVGSWLALSGDQTWTISAGASIDRECELLIEIRDVATSAVQDSATVTIRADNIPASGGGGGGGGGGSVSITDRTITKITLDGTEALATFEVHSGGTIRDHNGNVLETWKLAGASGDYDVRATVLSGGVDGSPTGTWLACSTSRSWSISDDSVGDGANSAQLLIEIRDDTTLAVLDSATININANAAIP